MTKINSMYKPWITEQINKIGYHRDYIKKHAVKLRSTFYHQAYKKCRNQLNALIKRTKIEYYNSKLLNAKIIQQRMLENYY